VNEDQRAAVLLSAAAGAALWWWWKFAPSASMVVGEGGPFADLVAPEFQAEDSAAPIGIVETVADAWSAAENFFLPVAWSMSSSNLQAFLMLIRTGEGTADAGGYSRLFGGGSFHELTDHPRQVVKAGGYTSTAAGAYQILSRTWDDLRANGVDLPDFTPANQDKAAVALIKRRGALADVLAGRFDKAIAKTNKEWASLPGSPYGQPTLSMQRARNVLLAFGASFDTGSIVV